jgi:Tol biopolymer transport system component
MTGISDRFGWRAQCVCGAGATPCLGIACTYIRVAMHTSAPTVLTARNHSRWTVQMAQRRAGRAASAAFVLGVVAACSTNETAPKHGSVGVQFIAGNGQSDTLQATLEQPLVVRVLDLEGQPAPQQRVQFVAVAGFEGGQAYAEPIGSQQASSTLTTTTDSSGRASVAVVLGIGAGPAHLVVQVPQFGYSDTAIFTVNPGNAFRVAVTPADTAIFVDSSLTLSVTVLDRGDNPRPKDPVTLSVGSGPGKVSGKRVTATSAGVITLVAGAAVLRDTALVSAVPPGTLATGAYGGGIAVFNLDGSNYHLITNLPAGTVKWAPSGTDAVFDETQGGEFGGTGGIDAINLSGAVTHVDSSATATAAWPQVSRDGVWVYYSRLAGLAAGSVIWRARLDGSGSSDSVLSQMPDFDIYPTPSPDGLQIAYVADHNSTTDLRVLTLATGAVRSLGVNAWSPAWSPTADVIAYVAGPGDPAPVAVIHSDGTGARTLTSATYYGNIDWSPDGQWIAGLNFNTHAIDIINATSGLTIQLPYTGSEWSPTWKPK